MSRIALMGWSTLGLLVALASGVVAETKVNVVVREHYFADVNGMADPNGTQVCFRMSFKAHTKLGSLNTTECEARTTTLTLAVCEGLAVTRASALYSGDLGAITAEDVAVAGCPQ